MAAGLQTQKIMVCMCKRSEMLANIRSIVMLNVLIYMIENVKFKTN